MEFFDKIGEIYEATKEDAAKFYGKGNGAAGTRLRKAYMEIIKACKDGRKDVSDVKNAAKEAKA